MLFRSNDENETLERIENVGLISSMNILYNCEFILATEYYLEAYGIGRNISKLWNLKTKELAKVFGENNNRHLSVLSCSAVNPSETLYATGSEDNNIKVWDLKTSELVYDFYANVNGISDLFFLDDKYLVSCSGPEIIIWNTDDGIKVLTYLISKNKKDYVIYDIDNYYKATKNGLQLITYEYNNVVYPFEQFDLSFNRPDILLSRLGSPWHDPVLIDLFNSAYLKRLKGNNWRQSLFSGDLQIGRAHV